ncbi:hypothetical protein [Streptomyces sp. NPDC001388]|uniref:hypothetical protein n=1 Tax=unclassified Streptomyces TaxID=2593676 RepID=UPI003688DD2B
MPLAADQPPRNASLTHVEADVLRIICDARHAVYVTVHANGRRRYSYWRPLDSVTGRGGCYVALPTAVCDQLKETGRIALGDPVTDPSRTVYRVRPVRVPTAASRLTPVPVRPVRARLRRVA